MLRLGILCFSQHSLLFAAANGDGDDDHDHDSDGHGIGRFATVERRGPMQSRFDAW